MPVEPDAQTIAFVLSERTVAQLDALVRRGHFATRQAAVTAAVDRLYARAWPPILRTAREMVSPSP